MKIKDPTIATTRYDFVNEITEAVNYEKWVDFIEQNCDYFTWLENTKEGKERLLNLYKIPESFRKGIIEGHNKKRAFCEYNLEKGYFEVYISYNKEFGLITTSFQKSLKKAHIKLLLEMAEHCEALLLNNGSEIITWETIGEEPPEKSV